MAGEIMSNGYLHWVKVEIPTGCAVENTARLRVLRECPRNAPIGSPLKQDGADRQVADGGSFYPF